MYVILPQHPKVELHNKLTFLDISIREPNYYNKLHYWKLQDLTE